MKNVKTQRIVSLFIDYLVWYIVMFLMVIVGYLFIYNKQPIAGDLQAYKEEFDVIMHDWKFIGLFIAFVFIYEVIIPVVFKGKTLSKKLTHLEIKYNNPMQLIVRGLLKIIIVNPSGVISYTLGILLNKEYINGISTILSCLLIINIVFVLKNKKAFHDSVCKTEVVM